MYSICCTDSLGYKFVTEANDLNYIELVYHVAKFKLSEELMS